jgi:pimeloyl-ACP methyl ester carboxylesterase
MQLIIKLAYWLLAVYAVVAVAAFVLQRRLMYFPDPERVSPASFNLPGVVERVIDAPDGARLITWYAPPASGQPTLLYFHGNAGNLASRSERVRRYVQRGYGVLFLSYRGYGGSTGKPSERANVADALLAYQALIKDGVDPEDIIVYGESLGSGVATQLAAQVPVGGLVLDAPYTSIVDVAALEYPYLPVRPFMFDRYETLRYLPKVKAPLLVLHGEDDRIIPVEMGKAVYAAANAPKEIATFPRAGHSDHHVYGSYDELFRWIDALRAKALEADPRIKGAAQ